MPIAVIVDWYGPYRKYESFVRAASHWGPNSKVLYMGISYRDDGTNLASVKYIGLSTNPSTRFNNHPKLRSEDVDGYYVGEITTAGIPGRRQKKTAPDLYAAEGALIAMVQPDLNSNRKKPPEDCVVVYSRFFGKGEVANPKRTPVWFSPLVAYNSWAREWSK